MDHSFNDRVDKVFGSISSSSSSTPWSLTDAQVERRVWNRDKADNRDDDDETLVSSSFDKLFNARRNRRKSLDEDDGDEWDIRSSIGLDSTLDNEEEEDAYDKMAEGRDKDGERLYMKDVTTDDDGEPYLNFHNIVRKDPCANHDAAKTMLKEDEPMLNVEEEEEEEEEAFSGPSTTEDGYGMSSRIKSILKRKNNDDDDAVKPAKRVRFDPNCKNDDHIRNSISIQPQGQGQGFGNGPSVPDYVTNPSKYTRYDLSHDKSQSKVIGAEDEKSSVGELPTTSTSSWVVFIPRKKRGDDAASSNHVEQPSTQGIGIAAVEVVQEEEEEEEAEIRQDCSKKLGRRYRSRVEQEDTAS